MPGLSANTFSKGSTQAMASIAATRGKSVAAMLAIAHVPDTLRVNGRTEESNVSMFPR